MLYLIDSLDSVVAEGTWTATRLTHGEAASLVRRYEGNPSMVSAVAKEATAEAMAEVFGLPVPTGSMDRSPRAGDQFLCPHPTGAGWQLVRYLSNRPQVHSLEAIETENLRTRGYLEDEISELRNRIRALEEGQDRCQAAGEEPAFYNPADVSPGPRSRGGTWGGGHMD